MPIYCKGYPGFTPKKCKPTTRLNSPINRRVIARSYVGGPHDGRTEQVPFERGQLLKQFVNKSEWSNRGSQKRDHFYVLMEPPQKATEQATYIYQYQPNFQPSVNGQKDLS